MKKKFVYLMIGLVSLSLFAGCGPAPTAPAPVTVPPAAAPTELPAQTETPEPIHIKLGALNLMSYAPLFIARDEGYFAEQGLDVEFIDFGSSATETIPALVTRQLDVAGPTLYVSIFNAIAQGNNLKFVADKGFMDPNTCTTDAWFASKTMLESGALTTPSSIKGKNVIFPPGGTHEYVMDLLLQQTGLMQSDIQKSHIADAATRVEGLKNGAVDVSFLSEPWITRAQASGAGDVWIPFSDIIPNQSLGTIVFGPGILDDKPEAGTRFMIAYLKAIKQFNQGKTDRNIEIIANYTKLSPEEIKASCWTGFKLDGLIENEGVVAFQKWALGKGYLDKTVEPAQFWDSKFLDEAIKKLGQ